VAIDVYLLLSKDSAPEFLPLPLKGEIPDTIGAGAGYLLELKGYHFGIENAMQPTSNSGGAGAGRASFEPLIVTKQVDQLTPYLLQLCGLGGHFGEMKLLLRRAGGAATKNGNKPYLVYTFKLAAVSSVKWTTSNADDVAEEHVTFSYGAVGVEYWTQDAAGKLSATPSVGAWSSTKNTAKLEV
jgi:type VI secretion system secreted protein Hcp